MPNPIQSHVLTPLGPKEGRSDTAQPGIRLDSWKEIAVYLGKGERTVKRWEKDRGLPTHRVPGAGRGSVFGFTTELDAWLQSGANNHPATAADEDDLSNSDAGSALREEARPVEAVIAPSALALAGAKTSPARARNVWSFALAGAAVLAVCLISLFALRSSARPAKAATTSIAGDSHSGRADATGSSPASPAVSAAEKGISHDLYLRGRFEWNKRNPDSLHRALDLFTQAISHDPGNAVAYAGLADTYNLLREYTDMPDSEAYPHAIVAAKKALELDGSLAEAHRALAFPEMWFVWDFADAGRHFRRAIALNPGDPIARKWYANAIASPGRFNEAIAEMDRAQELDPSSNDILADKGMMLFNAGRTSEAIALLKEVERSAPDFHAPHFYLMLISFDLHDDPTYLSEGELAARTMRDPVLADIMASARAGYERDGRRGMLEGLYAKQKEYYSAGKLWGTMLAKTCIQMGKTQEALDLLETAYARHEPYVLACVSSPDLLTLRDEPRYQALLAKINFPKSGDPGEAP